MNCIAAYAMSMDVSGVFSKLRNTLSSTVNEISAALPGNPLLREYDAGPQVGSAGPRFLWKVYEGTKKSTKAEVAIWILEKRQLDQFNRSEREMILEVFRRGCVQMTKLRHPQVLTVERGLEESRESIAFCTEPVFASVANVLGKRNNISAPSKELQEYELHEVEIKYGLLQVSEGLAFLHSSVKMIHGNICPESIIINGKGAWKIAGFDFCVPNSGTVSDVKFQCKDWDTSLPSATLPNPNYLAPEYILRKSCDTSSDLFSLGILLYAVYHKGKTLFQSGTQDVYRNMPKNADKLENLNIGLLEKIPAEVRDHEKMLLHPDPDVRPDADQMAKLPFFGHVGVMTLQYLDTLLQRENLQKSQFFKGLPKVIPQLPKRVVMQRVLPCLTAEFTNHDMIPFVLPNVMIIAEDCSKEQFIAFIFPALVPVFKVQKPIQVLLILLQKMDLLLLKTTPDKIQSHILPMLSSALAAPSLQIQELCMNIIPSFADQLDIPSVKNSILPRIRKICIEGETIAIRIHALVCVGKLVTCFNKWYVQDEILPFLQKVQSREPGVLMAILGVYQTVLKTDRLGISKEVMASKCLPFLIPLSVENTLNLKQYSSFLFVIKEMMQRVENEHRRKLEDLSKMQLQQDHALDFTRGESPQPQQPVPKISPGSVDNMFEQKISTNTEPVAKQHLTLEEKQRLAKMKEQEYRMKKEGAMKPVNLSKPMAKSSSNTNKPKDLTSSLLQNNLNAMSSRSQSTNSMMMSSQPMTSSQPMATGAMASQSAMQWRPGSTMNGSSYGMTKSTSFPNGNGMPTATNTSVMSQMNSMTLQPQQQRNLSSLDNILSMPSQQKHQPMKQMQGSHMMSQNMPQNQAMLNANPFLKAQNPPMTSHNPMMSQNSSMIPQFGGNINANKPNKNLSNQDLLDFLS